MLPQLSGRGTKYEGTINVIGWINSPTFTAMLKIAQDPRQNFTVFLPGPMTAWERQAAAQCLDLKDWLAEIAANPDMASRYIRSFFVPGAVNSSEFKDGLELRRLTAQPAVLVLGRKEV